MIAGVVVEESHPKPQRFPLVMAALIAAVSSYELRLVCVLDF